MFWIQHITASSRRAVADRQVASGVHLPSPSFSKQIARVTWLDQQPGIPGLEPENSVAIRVTGNQGVQEQSRSSSVNFKFGKLNVGAALGLQDALVFSHNQVFGFQGPFG